VLTENRLRELLDYNFKTGIFTWLISNTNRIKVGDIAGCNRGGYISINVDGKRYPAHRLVWLYLFGRFPINQLDHINHNGLDNRGCNLREVTNQENSRNSSKSKANTSGVTGVWFDKIREKWVAEIMVDGKKVYLGRFINKIYAIKARGEAEFEYEFHENHGK